MSKWLTSPPPTDLTPFLADVGWPWPVLACWNGADEKYIYANHQIDMYNGVLEDSYFENETAELHEIKRWKPLEFEE